MSYGHDPVSFLPPKESALVTHLVRLSVAPASPGAAPKGVTVNTSQLVTLTCKSILLQLCRFGLVRRGHRLSGLGREQRSADKYCDHPLTRSLQSIYRRVDEWPVAS
jgi:hypothetical protein